MKKGFFRSTRSKVIAVVIAMVFCGMLISAATYDTGPGGSSVIGFAAEPLQKVANAVYSAVAGFFDDFRSASSYREHISALESEVDELRGQLSDYEEKKHMLDEYSSYLELKEKNQDFKFVSAHVMTYDSMSPYYSFTIDIGQNDGASAGDPVIKGESLVGVILSVEKTYSVVRTILDPELNVSAYEMRTRKTGVVCGDAEASLSGCCIMEYLPRDSGILSDARVCTSGEGGIFPRGLVVGHVREIKNNSYDISAYAVIKPSAEIGSLNDVFVITDFEGKEDGGQQQ